MDPSRRKRRRTTKPPYITPRSYNRRFDNRDGTPSLDPGSTSRVHFPNPQRSSITKPSIPQNSISNFVDDEIPRQSIDDDLGHVIVAMDMGDSGTVGCSYYSAQEETLYLMGDIYFSGNETIDSCPSSRLTFMVLKKMLTAMAVILQTKPTVLLASAHVDYLTSRGLNSGQEDGIRENNTLTWFVERDADYYVPTETQTYLSYQLDIRPSQEFSGPSAKSKLTALEISATHEQCMQFFVPHGGIIGSEEMETEATSLTLQEGRLLHMSSSVDMENAITIGCAGAILTHLQRRRATDMVPGNRASDLFSINSLRMFGLQDTM